MGWCIVSERFRRIGAWGFEGESYPPSHEFLQWLDAAIGPSTPLPAADLSRVTIDGPNPLPDLGAGASTDPLDRLAHARGQGLPDLIRLRSGVVRATPDAVIRPGSDAEIERTLQVCARADTRVIPWGGGTSVTGGVNAVPHEQPAVVLSMERLAGMVTADQQSRLAVFRAGTLGPAIEAALAPHGLTLGHFPQSWELSTLGGWIVTRSSGQESLGYGSIDRMIAGLTLVAPQGRLDLPALPASAAGPDLRQVVLGSEGRLGVVTDATVRVRPKPELLTVTGTMLPSWEAGLAAARDLVQERVPLTLLRLSDAVETEVGMALGLSTRRFLGPLAKRYLSLRGVWVHACLILVGASGTRRLVRHALGDARGILRRHGGVGLGRAPGDRWQHDRFRHPYLRDALLERGIAAETLETAAPWSRIAIVTKAVRNALVTGLAPQGERVAVLCHVSHPYPDGASLYFTFFFRCPRDADEAIARWARLKHAATTAIVEHGATLTHHHGVGSWHAPWYQREVGPDGARLVAAAVRELDPDGIMNPHVLLDPIDRLVD